jgi:tRNA 2-thiocytidine biosynthesis protein TtcA
MDSLIPCARPPWTKCGKRLESTIRKALFDFDMLENETKIAVALSGGKDSLALLYMLKAISGRGFPPFTIHAIHIHGAFSCGAGIEPAFLKGICDELEVGFTSEYIDLESSKLECYTCSRKRRKRIFDIAHALDITTIAFGHHRDDNAQTLLMNLFHKGEFSPLQPKIKMHAFDKTIIRPLIYVAEHDIITFAEHHKFRRITCQCPHGQSSMRKKVDTLITDIEEYFPHARSNIASGGLRYGSNKACTRPK